MEVFSSKVSMLRIRGAEGLDQINVYTEDFEPGRGQITIICWGDAWTCFWGAMNGQTVSEFFISAGRDYLLNKLMSPLQKQTKRHEKYLARIIDAVKQGLSQQTEKQVYVAGASTCSTE